MRPSPMLFRGAIQLIALYLWLPHPASAQTKQIPPRVTESVDENKLTLLQGNIHPLARAEFDRGAAPRSLPLERMLLVLKRSPEQEAALDQLLDEQQDKSSPNYHRWLAPEQFGQQFGPPDADIQAATDWLTSQGFQVSQVSKGRTVIEFSGDAGLVLNAFHTEIHRFVVNGEEHWANATDQQIPTALASVVAGVATLHNFYKSPRIVMSDGPVSSPHTPGRGPLVNLTGGQHGLGPADYAVIYNINPLYQTGIGGGGTTIAVVGRSNINIQDVKDFRTLFGLSANVPEVVLNGPDPGVLPSDIEEAEGDLDVEWSGAIAPDAAVKFVVSAGTDTTDGVDLSEVYIIDNDLANVMTESFGGCEAHLGAEAANILNLAEQAAAQGITYVVASGDTGSAGCDSQDEAQAKGPVSVNILASTPFNVAVGGTELNENGNDRRYWKSANNQTTLEAAISYIPENVWNQSCAPSNCTVNQVPLAAGGGGSSQLFPKPSWQSGVEGIPHDGARDLPDVSLTSAIHDPYLICTHGSCTGNRETAKFAPVGGTSAAAPSFAAIMALVNQKVGSRQGQADYVLYRLAAAETLSKCNASSQSVLPAASCIFNDVTAGNNAVPGEAGYGTPSAAYGSGVGYDLASGLGSVNAANLVHDWTAVTFTASSTSLQISPQEDITHGSPVRIDISVAPRTGSGTPTGDVSLLTSTGKGVTDSTLNGGSVSSTTGLLPGGTYSLRAHYAGDGMFGGSDSASVGVTVSPEASRMKVEALAANPAGGPSSVPFTIGGSDSQVFLRADVAGLSGSGTATGTVNFTDNGAPLPGNPWTLNSEGNTITPNGLFRFAPGQHSIAASYGGDASFRPSGTTAPVSFTITRAVGSDFSLSAQPTITILRPGSEGIATLKIAGIGTYKGTVSFSPASCSGLPLETICTFSPASVKGSGATTLTIITTAPSNNAPGIESPPDRVGPLLTRGGIALCCMLIGFVVLGARTRLRCSTTALGLAVLGCLLVAAGCGGGGKAGNTNPGTPTGSYSLTVTATSGQTTHTITFKVDIQQ
jgi:hypothetical protein